VADSAADDCALPDLLTISLAGCPDLPVRASTIGAGAPCRPDPAQARRRGPSPPPLRV